MPTNMIYGKRKKSILTLLTALTNGDRSTNSPTSKAEKRASTQEKGGNSSNIDPLRTAGTFLPLGHKPLTIHSSVSATISMTAFYGKHNSSPIPQTTLALDDSIEEITSMLIDDTTMEQLTGEPRKRLSQLGSAKIFPHPGRQALFSDKALPRLPQLSFDDEDSDSFPPPVSRQPAHTRKSSAPPLPHKSSKRGPQWRAPNDSLEVKSITHGENYPNESRSPDKTTQHILKSPSASLKDGTNTAPPKSSLDVTQQIEAMLNASKALKPGSHSPLLDSTTLSKRSAGKANKVLSKMKKVITGHIHDKEFLKHYDPANRERLLDPRLSQLPDYDEEASTITAMELRINEGMNFGNPKIKSLTGHGTIRRKPVAGDGKSLMSRNSVEVSSQKETHPTTARSLRSFENRRHSSVSFDGTGDIDSPLPAKSHKLKDATKIETVMEVDFDSLFSSSPVAQSTPRIRLEPSFEENGDRKLKNVPADSRSLFDCDTSFQEPLSDVVINNTSPSDIHPRKLVVKRNSSQVKDVGLGMKSHVSKRRKKHPSPSKAELEGLEDNLAQYSSHTHSTEYQTEEQLAQSFGKLRTGEVLKSKDKNVTLLKAPKRDEKGNRAGIFGKSKQAGIVPSMAAPARRPKLKESKPSMIPKPAGAPTMQRRTKVRRYHLMTQEDESAMDTDELQWESSAYHIGMRGV